MKDKRVIKKALRVLPAVTRLMVYCRARVRGRFELVGNFECQRRLHFFLRNTFFENTFENSFSKFASLSLRESWMQVCRYQIISFSGHEQLICLKNNAQNKSQDYNLRTLIKLKFHGSIRVREYFWFEKALRVLAAKTRLTVYGRSRVLKVGQIWKQFFFKSIGNTGPRLPASNNIVFCCQNVNMNWKQ